MFFKNVHGHNTLIIIAKDDFDFSNLEETIKLALTNRDHDFWSED